MSKQVDGRSGPYGVDPTDMSPSRSPDFLFIVAFIIIIKEGEEAVEEVGDAVAGSRDGIGVLVMDEADIG